jgi:hypothetical protein
MCLNERRWNESAALLGANGRMLVEESLQNVEPLRRQNTFASFGPAPNSKDNNVPISGGGVFSNTWRQIRPHHLTMPLYDGNIIKGEHK